jgi:hypothetical protein
MASIVLFIFMLILKRATNLFKYIFIQNELREFLFNRENTYRQIIKKILMYKMPVMVIRLLSGSKIDTETSIR